MYASDFIFFNASSVLYERRACDVEDKKNFYYGIIKCLLFSQVKDIGKESYNIKRKIIPLDNGMVCKLKMVGRANLKKKTTKIKNFSVNIIAMQSQMIYLQKKEQKYATETFPKIHCRQSQIISIKYKKTKRKSSNNKFKKSYEKITTVIKTERQI